MIATFPCWVCEAVSTAVQFCMYGNTADIEAAFNQTACESNNAIMGLCELNLYFRDHDFVQG